MKNTPLEEARISYLYNKLSGVYEGDKKKIEHFLLMPHPLLEMQLPIDLAVKSFTSLRLVLDQLKKAEYSFPV